MAEVNRLSEVDRLQLQLDDERLSRAQCEVRAAQMLVTIAALRADATKNHVRSKYELVGEDFASSETGEIKRAPKPEPTTTAPPAPAPTPQTVAEPPAPAAKS